MPGINKTSVLVESSAIDLSYIDDLSDISPKIKLYSRPLRRTPDGQLGVLYKRRVYPLFNDEYSRPLLVMNLQSYEPLACRHVVEGEVYDVPYAFTPKKNSINEAGINWELLVNQFGIYIYINAADNIIEKLVVDLAETARYNVLTWDATNFVSEENMVYNWFIQLSSGLSSSAISLYLADFFSTLDLSEGKANEKIDLKNKIDALENEIITTDEAAEGKIKDIKSELEDAYLEISRLNELLVSSNESDEVSDNDILVKKKAQRLKRSNSEKVIGSIIYSLFPNLAFSPEAPKLIVTRFEKSQQLWKTLASLDNGSDVQKSALHGGAGKVGWKEVVKHISTGNDSRGRLYVRDSNGPHKLDVVLHWKKNKSEQDRLIKKLTTYKGFSSPAVVLN